MMKSWEGSKNTTISQSDIDRRNQCSYMGGKNNKRKKDHSEINQIRITKLFFFNRGKTILWKDMFQHPCVNWPKRSRISQLDLVVTRRSWVFGSAFPYLKEK